MKMNNKVLLQWICEKVSNYNLFVPEEDEFNNNHEATRNTSAIIKHQKYSTRLYVVLLILFLYVIFFIVFVNPQTKTVTISNITPSLFNQLRHEHGKTLSCPCSATIVLYKNFVSNTYSIDPICSSIFVNNEWINALYMPFASSFLIMDFRTTAYSQFELLAAFCSFSQTTISQILTDIDHQQLVTVELLLEDEVRSQVIENIELIRASTYVQISSPLAFLRITAQLNSLVSALNTNVHVTITAIDNQTFFLYVQPTVYFENNMPLFVLLKEVFSCNLVNSNTPSGFYSELYGIHVPFDSYWPDSILPPVLNASAMVDGFFSGCTPLDGLLTSTLDCLYNIKCLEQLLDYFPGLNKTNFNITSSLLPLNYSSNSLYDRLSNLFIENWLSSINYSKYFTECAPQLCTYTTNDQTSLFYTIIFLLSLYGGLTIILRLITPILVNITLIFEVHLKVNFVDSRNCLMFICKLVPWIKQLNLFKSLVDQNSKAVKRQYITTRIYLTLLTSSILSLLLFTSFSMQTTTMTVLNPSVNVYKNLQILHENTLKCPCSTETIMYQTFISLSPTFHQICSSDFVSDTWISFLSLIHSGYYNDWATRAVHQFRLLSTICELVNKTITDAVQRFMVRSLVTSNILTEGDFNAQSNTTVNQFIQSTIINFGLLIDTAQLFLQVDQPFKMSDYDLSSSYFNVNDFYKPDSWKLIFSLTGMFNTTFTFNNCVCAIDPYCQSPSTLYGLQQTSNNSYITTIIYMIPGSIDGCYALDSFLFSTLECFYSNSDCLSILTAQMNLSYSQIDTETPWFSAKPLTYNSSSSRFAPNISLSVITKQMMIEQWNYVASFDRYYAACAPYYCTYSYTAYTYSHIEVIIKMVSMMGGLITALRIITPQLVNFVCQLLQRKSKTSQEDHPKFFERVKITLRSLFQLFYMEMINLSIFPLHSFGDIVSRKRAKRFNQLATRLYILLLIIGSVILGLHTLIQPQILTKTFVKPSLTNYERLLSDHSDTLHCPCSLTSLSYDQFIKIEPIFHQVCSSLFVSEEWRMNITSDLIYKLPNYDRRDYRRFLSAHLQYLTGLCRLSNQSVNAAINQFLSSLFITTQLLPPFVLYVQINALIEETKSNVPVALLRLFSLFRIVNHGNAIVSAYGTNYDYLVPQISSRQIIDYVMRTQAINYDDNCSCALNATCTTPASFVKINSSNMISIKGLKMGCTPTESFLASTLECFYDLSCIHLIQEHIDYINNNDTTNILTSLTVNTSRFSIKAPIIDLVNDLFIENWSTTINYSLYFDQCLPTVCSYTYIQQLNSFYTITWLLSLIGGLTVILKWICPMFIQLIAAIYERFNKRTRRVEPIYTIEMLNRETASDISLSTNAVSNVDSPHYQSFLAISTSPIYFFSIRFRAIVFGLILLIGLITLITIPALYFTRREEDASISTIFASNITITTVNTNISETIALITTEAICQLTFELKVIYSLGPISWPYFLTTADFNADKHLDIVVLTAMEDSVGILLNNGNGTFAERKNYTSTNAAYKGGVVIGDFNNDSQLDLAIGNLYLSSIQVLIGVGDGTFEEPPLFSPTSSQSLLPIVIGDFNDDGRLDLAYTDYSTSNVGVMLGHGNGTFETPMMFSTGASSVPSSIAINDFNGDNHLDIAVTNPGTDNVGVFIGNGDGTFENQTTLSTGYNSFPSSITIIDVNIDNRIDIVIVDWRNHVVGVFLGNGNGTFGMLITSSTGHYNTPESMVVEDFNGDKHLDIAITNDYTSSVGILIGNGDGTFKTQIQFPIGNGSFPQMLTVGDFNGDRRLDIAVGTLLARNMSILFNTCECCNLI